MKCKNYTIFFNDWTALQSLVNNEKYSQVLVIVDENTEKYCLPIFSEYIKTPFSTIQITSGEQHKTIATCQYIWDRMIQLGADRHSLCVNLGGGVIGDMGGFTAATFMRGMDFIQLPTTLLSLVDASVGGKLGIDFHEYKNLVGIIKDPNGVFIFPEFLKTLPKDQIRSGFAEVIKHGLIADAPIFEELSQLSSLDEVDWTPIIEASVAIKRSVVEDDPLERGHRKILNFGHTLGHAIESICLSSDQPLLHGDAIAIGMIMETHLSYAKGYVSIEACDRVKTSILKIFGHHPDRIPTYEEIFPVMLHDKKNKGGSIKFSLLKKIGTANINQEVTPKHIQDAIEYYCKR